MATALTGAPVPMPTRRGLAATGMGTLLAVALLAVALLAVSGCGAAATGDAIGAGTGPGPGAQATGSSAAGVPPTADEFTDADEFNDADVTFLRQTLTQHAAAAELTRIAAERASDPQLRMLAAAVAVTQAGETETMTGWLIGWGQPVIPPIGSSGNDGPAGDGPANGSTGDGPAGDGSADPHGGHDVAHGTTAADVALLADAAPDEFDRTFVNILIAHQHYAVELARTVRDTGVNPQVRQFADQLDRSRSAQITHLLGLLG
ncbi:DUF305 domain-containing protein [Solwaraspora sp. WMMB335]|uniref:DUF305 domain-containing protein n=1 Tax=Solwaraspora sp. WMMB335 TaxID=3404118 RepID=UPI003B94D3C1